MCCIQDVSGDDRWWKVLDSVSGMEKGVIESSGLKMFGFYEMKQKGLRMKSDPQLGGISILTHF